MGELFGGRCAGQRGAEVTAPLDPIGCSLCVRVKALLSFLGSLLCFRHCKEDEEKGCVHTMQSEMRDVSKRIPPQSPSFLLSFSFHHFTLSHLSPLSENLSPSVKYVLETYFISLVLLSDLLNLSWLLKSPMCCCFFLRLLTYDRWNKTIGNSLLSCMINLWQLRSLN